MRTMHPVLHVGRYDWNAQVLPRSVFERRIDALRNTMNARNWQGIVVFGGIPEPGSLTYLTNFTPRLGGALALIPTQGEPAILSLDGGRMIPAGKLTTWIEDVRAARDVGDALAEWMGRLDDGRIAVSDFGAMPAKLYDRISSISALADADDATAVLQDLRRNKSAEEIGLIRRAGEALDAAAAALRDRFRRDSDAAAAVLAAEAAALNAGAQDVRSLYSDDAGRTFQPVEGPSGRAADSLIAYLAIRHRGYWSEGFVTVPSSAGAAKSTVAETMNALIDLARPGISGAQLHEVRNRHCKGRKGHPLVADRICHGIGVSPDEAPRPNGTEDGVLAAGDVCSFAIGVEDDAEGFAFDSAILHITEQGSDILWQGVTDK